MIKEIPNPGSLRNLALKLNQKRKSLIKHRLSMLVVGKGLMEVTPKDKACFSDWSKTRYTNLENRLCLKVAK